MHLTASSVPHVLTVLPLAFVHLPGLVHQFSVAAPLPVKPVADVVIAIRVDEPTEPVVDVVDELAFIDYVVDLFADASHLSVRCQLSDDILIILTLAEFDGLVDWYR